MEAWNYDPLPKLDASLTEALRDFPREPEMLHYALRSLAALILRAWLVMYHRLEIDGRRHLPETGSFVLVCNHTSHLDTLCLLAAMPLRKIHRTFPAAAADYFFSSLSRSAVSAILINALPFDRKLKGAESLSVCSELLKNAGNILIIFPEGTRTTTGEMGRFRSGIGRLVAGTGLPVVPCHLSGGMAAWPKGKTLPRPRKLRLKIDAPLNYRDSGSSPEDVVRVCADLETRVRQLGAPAA